MKLTSNEALDLLNSKRQKSEYIGWIEHSICVGNTAGKIAKALDLDEDYRGKKIGKNFYQMYLSLPKKII